MAERSFVRELHDLSWSAGEEFRGKGILGIAEAPPQPVSAYRDAPNLHRMDVLAGGQDILGELGAKFSAWASEAAAALSAPVMYTIEGAVAFMATVSTKLVSDGLANVHAAAPRRADFSGRRGLRLIFEKPISNIPGYAWPECKKWEKRMRILVTGVVAAMATVITMTSAMPQEVTLRAVTSFAEKTFNSRGFERFIEKVNADGRGLIQINYIGGPKAMPPFEVGNALKSGVVDVANVTGAFYTNLMPEADAWKLTERPMREIRANGGFDYMAKLYDQKLNAIFLARHVDNNPFHIYLVKPITSPDLTGLKLRITPVYRDFFQALGATVVQTAPGEVYTALERGVVDGYGWPITGIFDLGWQEKTKFRVDPGFYNAEVSILINKSSWAKLNDQQKKIIADAASWIEEQAADVVKENEADTAKQAAAGIRVIRFSEEQAVSYRRRAYEAGWAGIIRQSAEHGPRLKEYFAK